MTQQAATPKWRNRITRANVPVDPEQLLANPDNWRVHPAYQQRYMEGALEEIGWVKSVTVQDGTDLVIDGHMRIALALANREPFVPVDYVDLSDDECRLALAVVDAIPAYSVPDRDQLDALYRDVSTGNAHLQALVASFAEQANLYDASGDGLRALLGAGGADPHGGELGPDGAPAQGAEAETGEGERGGLLSLLHVTVDEPRHECHRGQEWALGGHLLIVADVFSEWQRWAAHLTDPAALFVPYPGPYVPLSVKAAEHPLVMVQPDLYVAGHILDAWEDATGTVPVLRGGHE